MKELKSLQKLLFLLVMFSVSAWANPKASDTTNIVNDCKAVDLGLSVKWATCNVGASSPEEYGGYYAWGETEEKSDYDWDTYKWCDISPELIRWTKYCVKSFSTKIPTEFVHLDTKKVTIKASGIADGKTRLDLQDDVAHVKWGGNWRMPTIEEFNELYEKCTWQWTTYKGVNGYLITGPNRKRIFIPAVGFRVATTIHNGTDNAYWSSDSHHVRIKEGIFEMDACNIVFNKNAIWAYSSNRCDGLPVRPVLDESLSNSEK